MDHTVSAAQLPQEKAAHAQTIHGWLEAGAALHPDKPFVRSIDQGTLVTYGEALRLARRMARFLAARGFRANDRVALLSENSLEHLKKFCKLTDKDAKAMQEELEKMGKLKDRQIIAVMNMMPNDMDELRVLFANEIVSLTEAQKKEILSAVKKYA